MAFSGEVIVVGEQPYAIWADDLSRETLQFLDQFDADFYEYSAHLCMRDIEEEFVYQPNRTVEDAARRGSVLLRACYSMGIETLFALLLAAIQAPRAVPVWLGQYSDRDLLELVNLLNSHVRILQPRASKVSDWHSLAAAVFSNLIMEDTGQRDVIVSEYAGLWDHLADQFLDPRFRKEFNSIKHGLRVHAGGFAVRLGAHDGPDKPAPPDRMHTYASGCYGSSFVAAEPVRAKSRHKTLERHYCSWSPRALEAGLELISMSLQNVTSYLRIQNGEAPATVKFVWPSDVDVFRAPWAPSGSGTLMGLTSSAKVAFPDELPSLSKEDLLRQYQA